jgi:HK97 family phage portal protein
MRLVQRDSHGIWNEVPAEGQQGSAFWPVLRKPNRYQTRIQFFESWVTSKLIRGNTYILKERDNRNVVRRLYVLDPNLVTVLLAPDGTLFYELKRDYLTGLDEPTVTFPESEIIHDRMNTIFHPLIGVSPIHACGLAATQGLQIQGSSTSFFASGSTPSAIIMPVSPHAINKEKADKLQQQWNSTYGPGGEKRGQIAVLGEEMKYIQLTMTAVDSQLLEQLKWTAETVASCFKVPPHMIGIGNPPTYNNIEALNQQYYSQCLQKLMEDIEELLDQGMGLGPVFGNNFGTEFDIEDLLRMDSKTKMEVVTAGVSRGIFSPNEARFKFNYGPVPGGESPYLQQQNFSLEALERRDEEEPPPSAMPLPTSAPETEETETNDDDEGGEEERGIDLVEVAPGIWVAPEEVANWLARKWLECSRPYNLVDNS